MSTCIFVNLVLFQNYSTCSQDSYLIIWQPFLFVHVINIHKMHAVLYCQFYETLNHTKFIKNLGNKGKLQVSSCRCLLHKNDPRDEHLGNIFCRTAPILQWRALDQTLDNQSLRQPKQVPNVYTIFQTSHWCTSDVHQHGVFIFGSVNFCESFQRIS